MEYISHSLPPSNWGKSRCSLTLSGVDSAFAPRLFSPSGILEIRHGSNELDSASSSKKVQPCHPERMSRSPEERRGRISRPAATDLSLKVTLCDWSNSQAQFIQIEPYLRNRRSGQIRPIPRLSHAPPTAVSLSLPFNLGHPSCPKRS